MRSIGAAQMALDLMIQRVTDPSRKTFGKYLYEHGALFGTILTLQSLIRELYQVLLSQILLNLARKSRGLVFWF